MLKNQSRQFKWISRKHSQNNQARIQNTGKKVSNRTKSQNQSANKRIIDWYLAKLSKLYLKLSVMVQGNPEVINILARFPSGGWEEGQQVESLQFDVNTNIF